MTTTLTPPATRVRRFYETFTVRWDDHASWSGFRTADEAQAVLDFASERGSGRTGVVERNEFSVVVDQLWCLGKTADGSPRHPLYLPAGTPLERWP